MYWVTGGFIFRRVVSPFHKLDPRTKLLVSTAFFLLSLVAPSIAAIVVILVAVAAVAALARSLRRVGRTMVFSLGFAAFIFVINFFFGLGFLNAVLYAVRFLAVISSTSLFFVTTSPDELEQIMKWMRVPRDVVFAFVTAVRFIPVVMLDALQIMDAQKSRGLELEKGNILRRMRNMVPVLVPLVVNSVIRSGQLAEAMESRGYGSTPHPTSLYAMRLRWYDVSVLAVTIAMTALAVYIYYGGRVGF